MFTKVLVPLDGTEHSESIVPYVARLASGMGMKVVLFSAVDPDSIYVPSNATTDDVRHLHLDQVLGNIEARYRSRHSVVESALEEAGVEVETVVSQGEPATAILSEAENRGCDLIAMCTQGRNVMGRGVLGSVTDKVLHSVDIPILTILPERAEQANQSISTIVVPLDGSTRSEDALEYAEALAKGLDARVALVRSFDLSGAVAGGDTLSIYNEYERIENDLEYEVSDYLDGLADRMKEKGLDVSARALSGPPAKVVSMYAEDIGDSIVVMSTHGHTGFTRWLMGSVTEYVVRSSGEPVLVVPRRD